MKEAEEGYLREWRKHKGPMNKKYLFLLCEAVVEVDPAVGAGG